MLPLLLSLLKTLEAFFSIRNTRAKWELERDIADYCDEIEIRIQKARAAGTADGDDLADRLRDRLLRSSGIAISSYAQQHGDSPPEPRGDVQSDQK
jgi:retron-type reverse transcriptase